VPPASGRTTPPVPAGWAPDPASVPQPGESSRAKIASSVVPVMGLQGEGDMAGLRVVARVNAWDAARRRGHVRI